MFRKIFDIAKNRPKSYNSQELLVELKDNFIDLEDKNILEKGLSLVERINEKSIFGELTQERELDSCISGLKESISGNSGVSSHLRSYLKNIDNYPVFKTIEDSLDEYRISCMLKNIVWRLASHRSKEEYPRTDNGIDLILTLQGSLDRKAFFDIKPIIINFFEAESNKGIKKQIKDYIENTNIGERSHKINQTYINAIKALFNPELIKKKAEDFLRAYKDGFLDFDTIPYDFTTFVSNYKYNSFLEDHQAMKYLFFKSGPFEEYIKTNLLDPLSSMKEKVYELRRRIVEQNGSLKSIMEFSCDYLIEHLDGYEKLSEDDMSLRMVSDKLCDKIAKKYKEIEDLLDEKLENIKSHMQAAIVMASDHYYKFGRNQKAFEEVKAHILQMNTDNIKGFKDLLILDRYCT